MYVVYLNFESCGSYFNSGVVFEDEMKERNKVSASPVIYCLAPSCSEILRWFLSSQSPRSHACTSQCALHCIHCINLYKNIRPVRGFQARIHRQEMLFDIAVEWLARLPRMQEVMGSNFGPETCYPGQGFFWFYSVPPGKYRYCTWN